MLERSPLFLFFDVSRTARLAISLLAGLSLCSGCSISDDEEEAIAFPAQAALIGEARGSVEGLDIECGLHFIIDRLDREKQVRGEIRAVMGGDARRTVLDEQGKGISFWADAFDSVSIAFPRPDQIVIRSRIHEPNGESQFWDELLRFEGTTSAAGQWAGTWKCFPLDTREDSVGIVEGAWTLAEIRPTASQP